jgi:hypothetical protein
MEPFRLRHSVPRTPKVRCASRRRVAITPCAQPQPSLPIGLLHFAARRNRNSNQASNAPHLSRFPTHVFIGYPLRAESGNRCGELEVPLSHGLRGDNGLKRSRLRGDRSKPGWGRFHCCRGTPRSISQPLIDNVLQGFALLKPAILLQKEAHRLILPVGRVVRAVRRHRHRIVSPQQQHHRCG